jgi:hypothetical protein
LAIYRRSTVFATIGEARVGLNTDGLESFKYLPFAKLSLHFEVTLHNSFDQGGAFNEER